MLVKVLFNIFLNLALIILAMMFYWTVAHAYYPIAAFVVVIFGMFVYFKVLLAKAVKEQIKNPKPPAPKGEKLGGKTKLKK